MTVTRIYKCNFCDGSDTAKLVGIHWTGNSAGEFEEKLPYDRTEHHLCRPCIRAIHKIGSTMSLEYDS